jgi:enolase
MLCKLLDISLTLYYKLQEKGKYEVMGGQQKVPEDVVEFWAELLGRYPSVIAIIDPMRKQVGSMC